MAEEGRDKTQVYLERAKSLEEKARSTFNMGFVALGSMLVLAKFLKNVIAQSIVILLGLGVAGVAVLQATIMSRDAERIWERLLRDPSPYPKLTLIQGILLLAIGVAALILALLGLWR